MGERNKTSKRCAGATGLTLALVACGGSGDVNVAGQSQQSGGLEEFCSVTAETFDGVASIENGESDWVDELPKDIERMRQLAPDDAPDSFDEFGAAYASIVDGLAAASADPSDTEVRTEVLESFDDLLEVDIDGLTVWLTDRCGEDLGTAWAQATDIGNDTGAGTVSLGSDPVDPSAPGTVASNSTTSTTSTTTTTTVPVVTTELLGDLRPTGTYLATRYQVDEVVATNADLLSYVDEDPFAGGVPLMIATVFAETDDYSSTLSFRDFKLTDPAGRTRSATGMFDERGELQSSIGLDTRDSAFVGVWFEVDSLPSTLDGWVLAVDGGGVPASMALDAVVEAPYPIELDMGPSVDVTQPSQLGNCGLETYRAEVTAAAVRLEADNGFVFRRAAPGRRYVNGSINMTNVGPVTDTACDDGAAVFSYDFSLLVDGRSIASSHGVERFAYLEPGGVRTRGFTFEIPSEASELQLVGMNDEVIATWDVALPEVAGE